MEMNTYKIESIFFSYISYHRVKNNLMDGVSLCPEYQITAEWLASFVRILMGNTGFGILTW
jgi:hypothetical protein